MSNLLGRALSVLAAYEHQLAKEALDPAREASRNAELRAVLISYMKQGMNQTQITRQLAEDGVRNSKGNPYNKQQIQRFVSRLRRDLRGDE